MPYGRGPWWVPYSRPAGGWSKPWRPRPVLHAPTPLKHYTRAVKAVLDMSASVVLNDQGGGFVQMAPDGMVSWEVRQAQVATSSGPTDASQAFCYRSGVFPHRAVAQTAQGGGDTFGLDMALRPGDTLICLWQGGNPGDEATLNISGTVHARVAG